MFTYNFSFRNWEKKRILLSRQTKQLIIEINVKLGSHVAIDDIKLEDCLPGNSIINYTLNDDTYCYYGQFSKNNIL